MAAVITERRTAAIEGDFVVLLIGMRINRIWKVRSWLPVARAMVRMIDELRRAGPASGLLGVQPLGTLSMVQYWRSFEALEAFARDTDGPHWPAWRDFNRRVRKHPGDVGIWHETYLVPAGQYETIYQGMPDHGLARATRSVPVTSRNDGAGRRLGRVA
jgi:hypothetical protein